jgi:hypothetical protein
MVGFAETVELFTAGSESNRKRAPITMGSRHIIFIKIIGLCRQQATEKLDSTLSVGYNYERGMSNGMARVLSPTFAL